MIPTDLPTLAKLIGPLPGGDTPRAWYISNHPEVLAGYAEFKTARKAWEDRVTELMELSGIKGRPRIRGFGGDYLLGFSIPEGAPPKGWRKHKDGYLVPRKRTRAERQSEILKRFEDLRNIPWALNYLPGMPHTVWMENSAFIPQVRKTGDVVMVFLGVDPNQAIEPLEPGGQWTQMKLSTYHLLRERQEATTW